MGRNRGKNRHLGFFGSEGWFTPIYQELKVTDAYRVLTPSERLILEDLIRVYLKTSNLGKEHLESGFEYTWSVCLENVWEDTLGRAKRRLLEVGFIDAPPEIQSERPGAPTRYQPSSSWRKYKPSADEANKIASYNKRRKKRIAEKNRRRSRFRSKMGEAKQKEYDQTKPIAHDQTKPIRTERYDQIEPIQAPSDTIPVRSNCADHIDTIWSSDGVEANDNGEIDFDDPMSVDILFENRRAAMWARDLDGMSCDEVLAAMPSGVSTRWVGT